MGCILLILKNFWIWPPGSGAAGCLWTGKNEIFFLFLKSYSSTYNKKYASFILSLFVVQFSLGGILITCCCKNKFLRAFKELCSLDRHCARHVRSSSSEPTTKLFHDFLVQKARNEKHSLARRHFMK